MKSNIPLLLSNPNLNFQKIATFTQSENPLFLEMRLELVLRICIEHPNIDPNFEVLTEIVDQLDSFPRNQESLILVLTDMLKLEKSQPIFLWICSKTDFVTRVFSKLFEHDYLVETILAFLEPFFVQYAQMVQLNTLDFRELFKIKHL